MERPKEILNIMFMRTVTRMSDNIDYSIDALADETQKNLYKKFPSTHFLSNPTNLDHFYRWNTFFRRNFHRFSEDILKINLYPFQALTLYEMGVNNRIFIVAARAASKSFMIALYACIKCILYPHTKTLLCSATKGQSELIVTEKIQTELMSWSPILAREIESIRSNQNKTIVKFHNQSQIVVAHASDNIRGNRSTDLCREECRQIDRWIDETAISPCQVLRQAPYMLSEQYINMPELKNEPTDIYITSSWFGGHWMWEIVDNTYQDMMNGGKSCLLAFDESVILKHHIKSQVQLRNEKRKLDPISWALEYENQKIIENTSAFFSYEMLHQNQVCKQPFYPRKTLDVLNGKRNPYDIPRQPGEIRIVSCDMAFVTRKGNDNSVFTCARLLPESNTYKGDDSKEVTVSAGYRIVYCYAESVQGGDTDWQALRIRQLFNDFTGGISSSSYIVLDCRNAGISIYDKLAKVMYDEERHMEYSPLICMNDDALAMRTKSDGGVPCIYAINASQKLNSDIALNFRMRLDQKKIDLLVPFEIAKEEILFNNKDYINAIEAEDQIFYETPFLETQAMIGECIELTYEKKEQTGMIVIRENPNKTKDRYVSYAYAALFTAKLETDMATGNEEYQYEVFVN